ncbi:MAG: ABC transporter permease [Chloroflexi bacterium]|nr:ABC transporter permease [Chloroflexota bacterium]
MITQATPNSDSNPNSNTLLTGPAAWLDSLFEMSKKELLIMLRYPVEFVASFGQVFIIVTILTLAGLMFSPGGVKNAGESSQTSGLVVYGFILFMFLSDTLWTIGYNVRREQKQGTLEQLYLSPASKFASLVSRVTITLVWTGLLSATSAWLMSAMIGRLPFANVPLGVFILALSLSGTFGVGFAFAGLTLRVKEAGQTLANFLQFAFMVICAPFYPFFALPDWAQPVARLIPLSYTVDAFRSTLMNYPPGFPELAPIGVEIVIVVLFGLLMPPLGYWFYRREEDSARRKGSLSEY